MEKSIKVKGSIKVDNSDLKKIRAGSCAHLGKECECDIVLQEQIEMEGARVVDRLYI